MIALRPKLSNFTSSATSSPTSKSASILRASDKLILSWSPMSSALSSTIALKRHSCKSPSSRLMIISKLSSTSNLFRIIALKTSSRILITVGRSIFLDFANSANDSINILLFMVTSVRLPLWLTYKNRGFCPLT